MSKINITLDINAISRDKIVEREIKTQNGPRTVREYKITIMPLKEKKFVTQGFTKDGLRAWKMYKTHFVTEAKSHKDEEDVFVGSGFDFEFVDNDVEQKPVAKTQSTPKPWKKTEDQLEYPKEDINPDDVPF